MLKPRADDTNLIQQQRDAESGGGQEHGDRALGDLHRARPIEGRHRRDVVHRGKRVRRVAVAFARHRHGNCGCDAGGDQQDRLGIVPADACVIQPGVRCPSNVFRDTGGR